MAIKYDDFGKVKRPGIEIAFSKEQISEIKNCAKSAEYFGEHYYYIVTEKQGSVLIKFFDFQRKIVNNLQNHRFNILLASRQVGKTTTSAIYILWFAIFHKHKTIAILANKAKTAKAILAEIKYAYEELPIWLKPGVKSYNEYNVEFENGSRLIAGATSADTIRGETISLLLLDEFAFVPQNIASDFWAGSFPTIATGGRVIVVSTPKGTGNLFHELWIKAIRGVSDFKPIKVGWQEHPDRDEHWKKKQLGAIGKIRFAQEYDCSFAGSTVTLIDADFMENHLIPEDALNSPDDFTRIWEEPQLGHSYVASVDVAAGVKNDSSVINIFDITYYPEKPATQVYMYRSNEIGVPALAEELHRMCVYYNNAYTIIESNSNYGGEIINKFTGKDEEYSHLYYENVFYDYDKQDYGVNANQATKPFAQQQFKMLLESKKIIIKSDKMIEELGYYEEIRPNIFKARMGLHDDTVATGIWLGYFLRSKYFEDIKGEIKHRIENPFQKSNEETDNENIQSVFDAFLLHDSLVNSENWLDHHENGKNIDEFGWDSDGESYDMF